MLIIAAYRVIKGIRTEVDMKSRFWCRISLILTILALTLYSDGVKGQRAGKFFYFQ